MTRVEISDDENSGGVTRWDPNVVSESSIEAASIEEADVRTPPLRTQQWRSHIWVLHKKPTGQIGLGHGLTPRALEAAISMLVSPNDVAMPTKCTDLVLVRSEISDLRSEI